MINLELIALLCQLNVGGMGVTIEKVQEAQVQCHKYYIICLETKDLTTCVKDRK